MVYLEGSIARDICVQQRAGRASPRGLSVPRAPDKQGESPSPGAMFLSHCARIREPRARSSGGGAGNRTQVHDGRNVFLQWAFHAADFHRNPVCRMPVAPILPISCHLALNPSAAGLPELHPNPYLFHSRRPKFGLGALSDCPAYASFVEHSIIPYRVRKSRAFSFSRGERLRA